MKQAKDLIDIEKAEAALNGLSEKAKALISEDVKKAFEEVQKAAKTTKPEQTTSQEQTTTQETATQEQTSKPEQTTTSEQTAKQGATTTTGQTTTPIPTKKATIKASKKTVKYGKKSTVNITSNSGAKLSVKGKNSLAKNKKCVTVKGGKTAKIIFKKTAPKGKYKFTVTSPANGSFKKTTKNIVIRVK